MKVFFIYLELNLEESFMKKNRIVAESNKDLNVFGVNECVICDPNRKLPKVYGDKKKATDLIY